MKRSFFGNHPRQSRHALVAVVFSLAAGPLAVMACGPDEPEAKVPVKTVSSPAPTPEPTPTTTASTTAEVPKPAPPAVTVSDMVPTPDPTPLPTVKIVAPGNELSIGADAAKAKDYQIRLDVKNWNLAKGSNHVHLILDNYPYKPIYDAKTPIKLAELLPANTEIAEGQHVLYAFPSRPNHESVKGKGAMAMVSFWVGKKGKATLDPKKPMLIYSRPKGDNFGGMGKEVMIDFYLANTTLDDGSKVRFTVTGTLLDKPIAGEFTKWAPKILTNLQKGEYEVKLELLDKDGKVSDNPLNTTTRKINVDAEKPMDPGMGMAPSEKMDASSMSAAVNSAAASASASSKMAAPKGSK